MNLKNIDEIIGKYEYDTSCLIMILQDIQEQFNYLPTKAIKTVAEKLKIPLSRVYQVATFYSSFSLTERGKYVIRVCDGTACHLRGFVNLRDEITNQLGITEGQTTADKKFTLEVVACLGTCAIAPVMAINSDYHAQMSVSQIREVLAEYA